MINDMNKGLAFLCEKYSVQKGELVEIDGKTKLKMADGTVCVLLPWRIERRFFELKSLLQRQILEDVSTLRFNSMTAGGCLKAQVAKEMDLAAWMMDSKVASLFASCSVDNSVANVIVKLANDMSVCVECSNKLPAGSRTMDRHELIARRGLASDQAVDTEVPQASIYAFTDKGEERYTDTDAELFGMSQDEILLTRAAFAVLSNPALAAEWNAAAETMEVLSSAVFESDKSRKVMTF